MTIEYCNRSIEVPEYSDRSFNIRNRARDILKGLSDDGRYWVMGKNLLAQKVGCSVDDLDIALKHCLNFDNQGLVNGKFTRWAYYTDSDITEGFYGF